MNAYFTDTMTNVSDATRFAMNLLGDADDTVLLEQFHNAQVLITMVLLSTRLTNPISHSATLLTIESTLGYWLGHLRVNPDTFEPAMQRRVESSPNHVRNLFLNRTRWLFNLAPHRRETLFVSLQQFLTRTRFQV